MTTKSSVPAAAQKKLHAQIATAQKQAEVGKKIAKLAKLGLRHAKQKFKDARRAAKKLRKAVKSLKTELAALAVKKPGRKSAPSKSAARKRSRPVALSAPIPSPVETLPVQSESTPVVPLL